MVDRIIVTNKTLLLTLQSLSCGGSRVVMQMRSTTGATTNGRPGIQEFMFGRKGKEGGGE